MHILLVEDNSSDAKLAVRALKTSSLNAHIDVVKDGVEALNFLHQHSPFENATRPDLIVLDLNLPRMDGFELLSELKSTSQFGSIPVMALTTSASPSDRERCLKLKADYFFTKPMRFEDFSILVTEVEQFSRK